MNDVYDKTRMFAAVPHDVLDQVKNANAIALYTILKRYAGANGKAHPSRKKLAADMGFKSVMPVDKALEELRLAGLVQTFPRFKDEFGKIAHERDDEHREQTSNGYIITDPHTSQMYTPYVRNVDPHTSQMYTPYITDVHEVDTPEVDTSEVSPCSPPEGDGPQGELISISQATAPQKQSGASPYPDAFQAWWSDYPKKKAKGDALKAWRKAKKAIGTESLHERLRERLPGLMAVMERDPTYVPNPATWLNGKRYDDPVEATPQPMTKQDQRRQKLVEAAQQLNTPRQEPTYEQQQLG